MNLPRPVSDPGPGSQRPVFLSYATADRQQALKVCQAIENRGVDCWISSRDVPPGANYQEAIVQAIREARAMVLVFSAAANRSDEIKKELSLASRYQVPVLTLRLEDVEPGDAFAYELSTRQWIDAFDDWDRSIDLLVGRIGQLSGEAPTAKPIAPAAQRPAPFLSRRVMTVAAAATVLLLAVAGGLWWYRAPSAAAHSMIVRLAGFKLLSPDLPAAMRDTVDAEIAAAFNADGAVGVSTGPASTQGAAPGYALGGTVQRVADKIRVITRLTNERSGVTLWSSTLDYDGNEASRVPRHIAVDAGNVVRCGLFGASTYRKALPDAVLRDYMQFCQAHWDPALSEGRKALVPAQRVVAAVPDFSWGWAAVAGAYWKVAITAGSERLTEEARATGREAADRAVAIDGRNSEALYIKAMLMEPHDWIERDSLFRRAVAARRLDCGCEHHQYGWMLVDVGRIVDAVDQLRQANDMLALYVYTPLTLASALVVAGKPEEAKTHYDAAIDLAPNAAFAGQLTASAAIATGDIARLSDPKLPISPELRTALLQGLRAAGSPDPSAKSGAVRALLTLPAEQQNAAVARLLGKLGEVHEAFQVAARIADGQYHGPAVFWYPEMRQTLADPGFPALATQIGLFKYWKATKTKPDVCGEQAPPPFCAMI